PLTQARSDLEIAMVANYITLTPGTLTVDVSADRSILLIHALTGGDSGDELRAQVRDSIEPRVLEVVRPCSSRRCRAGSSVSRWRSARSACSRRAPARRGGCSPGRRWPARRRRSCSSLAFSWA